VLLGPDAKEQCRAARAASCTNEHNHLENILMNGGLMKTTSRLAIAAAASVLATSAMAADLGGNCCADLEERIADLEATTVRKGNRKVSLTLSGQVHQSILFWDDGHERNTYVGTNNINSSTRFRMVGQAKIDAEWSAGYLIEIEPFGKSNSSSVNQIADDTNNTSTNSTGGFGSNTRHSAWWIDNKRLGRIWLGLTDTATAGIEGINLANTAYVANNKVGLLQGGFLLRRNDGFLSSATWGSIQGGNSGYPGLGNETRMNTLKYVSPTVAGFIFSAAFAEDDFWDASLKYANEFNGVRVAAGIGYAQSGDANPNDTGTGGANNNGCVDLGPGTTSDRDCSSLVIAGSLMHVPTGLFVSGYWGRRTDDNRGKAGSAINAAVQAAVEKDDTGWSITAGVERNFFGLGKTTLYGEYESWEGGVVASGKAGIAASAANGFGATVIGSSVDVWGLGIVQSIDAAAMDLYIGYRNYSGDVSVLAGETAPQFQDFSIINAGGVIKF
jgi:hypothetical protein